MEEGDGAVDVLVSRGGPITDIFPELCDDLSGTVAEDELDPPGVLRLSHRHRAPRARESPAALVHAKSSLGASVARDTAESSHLFLYCSHRLLAAPTEQLTFTSEVDQIEQTVKAGNGSEVCDIRQCSLSSGLTSSHDPTRQLVHCETGLDASRTPLLCIAVTIDHFWRLS
ncbi:unnamed protein product [Pleuronectes platessa]|uniref:Uncharacterized protein n=1 Tax=Pleuronectes platessa TaxID=8262 RepID=A0A9N7TMH1_PLEPL|nr:unnamed protein product [Pleuronectes platessa]